AAGKARAEPEDDQLSSKGGVTSPSRRVRSGAAERPAGPAPHDEEWDLRDVFKVLRRRLNVIIITVLVVTVCTGLFALNLTPRYTASSTIVVEPRETRIIFDQERRDVPEDVSTINTHVKFLTSRSFAKKVIGRLDLVRDAEFNPDLREETEVASGEPVRSRLWSWAQMPLIAIGLASQAPSSASDPLDDTVIEEVTAAFLGHLEVDPSGQSYAITVAFTSVHPETAARVANTMAQLYVDHQLEAKQAATTGAIDWLAHRLDELREQLLQSERAAEQYRAENELALSAEGLEFSDEELMALTQELISAQAERVALEAKLDRIQQVRGSREGLDSIPEVMMSPIIADLRQQQMEILRTEAQLRQEYGPRHPAILQVQADKDK